MSDLSDIMPGDIVEVSYENLIAICERGEAHRDRLRTEVG